MRFTTRDGEVRETLQARLDEQAANASSQHDQLSALSASAEEGQTFAREALDEQRATHARMRKKQEPDSNAKVLAPAPVSTR